MSKLAEAMGGLIEALNSDIVLQILDLVRKAFSPDPKEDINQFIARKDLPKIPT